MKSFFGFRRFISILIFLLLLSCFGCLTKSQKDLYFVKLDGGWSHSLGLTQKGEVYIWGNMYARTDIDDYPRPTLVTFSDMPQYDYIVDISAGEFQSYALSTNGTIYGWGLGTLGDNTDLDRYSPTPITIDDLYATEKVINVSTKYNKAAAITNLGRLFVWGYFMQSGLFAEDLFKPVLVEIDDLENNELITDVSFGETHIIALTSLGRVFTWGKNESGQLGNGNYTDNFEPTEVTFPGISDGERIEYIASGWSHNLAATRNRIYVWGYNQYYQLGDGTKKNRNEPIELILGEDIGEENIEGIACGGDSSAAIWNNRVYTWGHYDSDYLDRNVFLFSTVPFETILPDSSNPNYIALGSNFVLVSTDSSSAKGYAWGGNAYYQLGDGTTKTRKKPVRIF